jgi:hypothetical protein
MWCFLHRDISDKRRGHLILFLPLLKSATLCYIRSGRTLILQCFQHICIYLQILLYKVIIRNNEPDGIENATHNTFARLDIYRVQRGRKGHYQL